MTKKNVEDKPTRPLLLLVDDVEENLHVLAQHLAGEYELAFASDGAQAVSLAVEILPSLILLDIMMPGLDGVETCRLLKKTPATAAIPVIFLTAKADLDDIVKGFDAGAVDYVAKPFRASELCARVRTHVQLHSLKSFLSICSQCHRIRNETDQWERLDHYVSRHAKTIFSHGFCPDCFARITESL